MTVAARVRQFAAWLESCADRDEIDREETVPFWTFAPPSGRGSPAAPAPPSTTAAAEDRRNRDRRVTH